MSAGCVVLFLLSYVHFTLHPLRILPLFAATTRNILLFVVTVCDILRVVILVSRGVRLWHLGPRRQRNVVIVPIVRRITVFVTVTFTVGLPSSMRGNAIIAFRHPSNRFKCFGCNPNRYRLLWKVHEIIFYRTVYNVLTVYIELISENYFSTQTSANQSHLNPSYVLWSDLNANNPDHDLVYARI